MNLTEINSLINIRQYALNSLNNSAIDRPTVNYLNGILHLLDKKIIGILSTDEFKEYINYSNVKETIQEIAKLNNFKSSLKQ